MVPLSVNVMASEDIPHPKIKRKWDTGVSLVNINQNIVISSIPSQPGVMKKPYTLYNSTKLDIEMDISNVALTSLGKHQNPSRVKDDGNQIINSDEGY